MNGRIAILGATGRLGRLLVSEALEREYEVHALARAPRRAQTANERFTLLKGDAETGAGLDALLEGCDYVVCALGSRKPVLEHCMRNLVAVLRRSRRLERVVLISRAGAGEPSAERQRQGLLQRLRRALQRRTLRDLGAAEDALRGSGLPYCIFRADRLSNGPPRDGLVALEAPPPRPAKLPRADLARFVVETLPERRWVGRDVTLARRA